MTTEEQKRIQTNLVLGRAWCFNLPNLELYGGAKDLTIEQLKDIIRLLEANTRSEVLEMFIAMLKESQECKDVFEDLLKNNMEVIE